MSQADARSEARTAALGWVERQRLALLDTWSRIRLAPLGHAFTVALIAISLVVPTVIFNLVDGLNGLGERWRANTRVTAYLEANIDDRAGDALAEAIATRDDVRSAYYVSRAQAAEDFKTWTGLGELLDGLGENPLPGAVVIEPAVDLSDEAASLALAESIDEIAGVDDTEIDLAALERLNGAIDALNGGARVLSLLLGLSVLATVGHALRQDLLERQTEIEVSRLVGASDQYIRKPFLITGALYGLAGGLVAGLLSSLVIAAINGPVNRLTAELANGFSFTGPGLTGWLGLMFVGALLGVAAAWLVIWQYLRKQG